MADHNSSHVNTTTPSAIECSISMYDTINSSNAGTSTILATPEYPTEKYSNTSLSSLDRTADPTTTAVTTTMEEMLRFGTAFGYTASTAAEMSSSTTISTTLSTSNLSDEAQRHYHTFQLWKQRHAPYLYHIRKQNDTTGSDTTDDNINTLDHHTDRQSSPETSEYDQMDALEWYDAFQYSIQYHLWNDKNRCIHDDDDTKNKNSPLDISTLSLSTTSSQPHRDYHHHHFRIIMAPPSARATTTTTTAMMTQHHSTTSTKTTSPPQPQSSPSRILYILPAGMNISSLPPTIPTPPTGNQNKKDISKQMMEVYTTAFAVYIYRTLFVIPNQTTTPDSDTTTQVPNKITMILDVRKGGHHWPNIPAIQFVSYIRHVATILPYYFPNLCTQFLLYPIPAMACTLYNLCIKPILDRNIQHMIQLVTTSTTIPDTSNDTVDQPDTKDERRRKPNLTKKSSPPNTGGLHRYLAHDDVHYLEALRSNIIHPPTVTKSP